MEEINSFAFLDELQTIVGRGDRITSNLKYTNNYAQIEPLKKSTHIEEEIKIPNSVIKKPKIKWLNSSAEELFLQESDNILNIIDADPNYLSKYIQDSPFNEFASKFKNVN